MTKIKILILGADGFIGRNFRSVVANDDKYFVKCFVKNDAIQDLKDDFAWADIVFHLAGQNRADDDKLFYINNVEFTRSLCQIAENTHRKYKNCPTIVFASSIRVGEKTVYGETKKLCEELLQNLRKTCGINSVIMRLPNVFGKWAKVKSNSFVATFCHNLINNLPIELYSGDKQIDLLYVDDLVSDMKNFVDSEVGKRRGCSTICLSPFYSTTPKEVLGVLRSFANLDCDVMVGAVGSGLHRALFATYKSYLPTSRLIQKLSSFSDDRGEFFEVLKTPSHGQVSVFTIAPGKFRGGHFHHTKVEKFFVVKGTAKFNFVNVDTNDNWQVTVSDQEKLVVHSIPGWWHELSNEGEQEAILVVWASELYDSQNADTFRLIGYQ